MNMVGKRLKRMAAEDNMEAMLDKLQEVGNYATKMKGVLKKIDELGVTSTTADVNAVYDEYRFVVDALNDKIVEFSELTKK
jgi:hypothetical protein